mmetsp:Transcript_88827/g.173809  ORF Transcript_88827/g.173809 Transcript_88827/m.173809 type:complete len:88 (-) Transcript_88827:1705-1968(-)
MVEWYPFTFSPNLVQEMATQGDDEGGMVQSADHGLQFLPVRFPCLDHRYQIPSPGQMLVVGEGDLEIPCPDLPPEDYLPFCASSLRL